MNIKYENINQKQIIVMKINKYIWAKILNNFEYI